MKILEADLYSQVRTLSTKLATSVKPPPSHSKRMCSNYPSLAIKISKCPRISGNEHTHALSGSTCIQPSLGCMH